MDVIFTAAGNKRYAEIAMQCGMLYGARLPATVYYPPYFVDQFYHDPKRDKYMASLAEHRPTIATVIDHEAHVPLCEVISWLDEASQYVQEAVIFIPKVVGVIATLPRSINGRQLRLGYSVETSYGGTTVPYHEFCGWPVHLLGGDPHQMLALMDVLNVVSVDGNGWMDQANRNQVWQSHPLPYGIGIKNRWWPQLQELGLGHIETDTCYKAFELSCQNIVEALNGKTKPIPIQWQLF